MPLGIRQPSLGRLSTGSPGAKSLGHARGMKAISLKTGMKGLWIGSSLFSVGERKSYL
jgi:hypothetical protein